MYLTPTTALIATIVCQAQAPIYSIDAALTQAEMRQHAEQLDIAIEDIDLAWTNYQHQLEKLRLAQRCVQDFKQYHRHKSGNVWPIPQPPFSDVPVDDLPPALELSIGLYMEPFNDLSWDGLYSINQWYFDILRGMASSIEAADAAERAFYRDRLLSKLYNQRAWIDVLGLIDETLPDLREQRQYRQLFEAFEIALHERVMENRGRESEQTRVSRQSRARFAAEELTPEQYLRQNGYMVRWLLAAEVIQSNDTLIVELTRQLPQTDARRLNEAWGGALFPYIWKAGAGDLALARTIKDADNADLIDAARDMQSKLRELRERWTQRLRAVQLRLESPEHIWTDGLRRYKAQLEGRREQDPLADELAGLAEQAKQEIAALQQRAIRLVGDER